MCAAGWLREAWLQSSYSAQAGVPVLLKPVWRDTM
jgi:hypothetical protein